MENKQIESILPHRRSMLLVDRVELTGKNSSRGEYKVTGKEWFLDGHFPGNPIVPGVILCEMMAQASCIILLERLKTSTPYFSGMQNVKFRKKVLPGDLFVSVCELIKNRGPFYFANTKGYVNDELCVSAELSFALIKEV